MLQKHHLAIIILCLLIGVFIGFPILLEPSSTPINSGSEPGENISEKVDRMEADISNPTNPIQITIAYSDEEAKSTYYYDPETDIKKELIDTEKESIYKIQDGAQLHIARYNKEEASIRETTVSMYDATTTQKILFHNTIEDVTQLNMRYNTENARIVKETESSTTYELDSRGSSDKTLELTIIDNQITRIKSDDFTVDITYNSEDIKKPSETEADTSGDEEETDCSDLDHC